MSRRVFHQFWTGLCSSTGGGRESAETGRFAEDIGRKRLHAGLGANTGHVPPKPELCPCGVSAQCVPSETLRQPYFLCDRIFFDSPTILQRLKEAAEEMNAIVEDAVQVILGSGSFKPKVSKNRQIPTDFHRGQEANGHVLEIDSHDIELFLGYSGVDAHSAIVEEADQNLWNGSLHNEMVRLSTTLLVKSFLNNSKFCSQSLAGRNLKYTQFFYSRFLAKKIFILQRKNSMQSK